MAVKVREGIDYKILSDDYRAEYFKHNKPVKVKRENFNGVVQEVRYYRCIYTGKLLPHIGLNIDHIIPKTRFMAGILWNPNKAWNLGASSESENKSKSNYVDSRIITGFKNKIRYKWGLGAGEASGYASTDDPKVKNMMRMIMALIYLISFMTPFLLVLMFGIRATLYLANHAVRIIWKLSKKTIRFVGKCAMHPIKTAQTVVGIVVLIFLVNLAIKHFGGPMEAVEGIVGWAKLLFNKGKEIVEVCKSLVA